MQLGELLSAVIRRGTFQPSKVGHYRRRLHPAKIPLPLRCRPRAKVREMLGSRRGLLLCTVARAGQISVRSEVRGLPGPFLVQ